MTLLSLGTFDQFKATFKSLGVVKDLPNVFCASMSSGILYSVITMPMETAKNRMAFQKPDPTTGNQLRIRSTYSGLGKIPYTGTIQTVGSIISKEGPLKLWQGFLPYYLRCGGHTVFMFVAVEYLRKLYLKTVSS